MASTAFADAYVKYLTKFPTLLALGSADADGYPAAWKAELDAVSSGAFDPVIFTSLTLEGGNAAGSRNFAEMHLVRALYAVRAVRDPAFTNPYTQPIPDALAPQPIGFRVRLGTGNF